MAISHIPRSVGHNFAPEYQISAIPYFIQLNANTPGEERIVVHKSTGTIAATDPQENGNLVLITTSGFTENDLKDDDNGTFTTSNLHGDFAIIYRIKLPKIAQWIQVKNIGTSKIHEIQGGAPADDITFTTNLSLWFHPKGAANNSVNGKFLISANEISDVYHLRFTTIYLQNSNANFSTGAELRIGLTTIEASEFNDVVETFLNSEL